MSELWRGRLRRQLLLGASVSLTVPVISGAQSAADYRRQLDEIEPAWRAAGAAVKAAETARQVTARSVTIERGSLRVIADSIIADRVVDGVEIAARQIDDTFGASGRRLLDHPVVLRHRVVVRNGDTTYSIGARGSGREQTVALRNPAATQAQLVAALGGAVVVGVLHTALDDSLRRWFHTPFPAGIPPRIELARAYVELVTASTNISRRCLAGELLGCRQQLGIAASENFVIDGLTAEQRRSIVAGSGPRLRTPGKAAEFDRCVREDDDVACVARLGELSVKSLFRATSSVDMRRSFARVVLATGGNGSYARLEADDSIPLAARFAAAGGQPVDSLVAAWRTSVLSARPASSSVTPAGALATLAWIVACGALALRSSRWR